MLRTRIRQQMIRRVLTGKILHSSPLLLLSFTFCQRFLPFRVCCHNMWPFGMWILPLMKHHRCATVSAWWDSVDTKHVMLSRLTLHIGFQDDWSSQKIIHYHKNCREKPSYIECDGIYGSDCKLLTYLMNIMHRFNISEPCQLFFGLLVKCWKPEPVARIASVWWAYSILIVKELTSYICHGTAQCYQLMWHVSDWNTVLLYAWNALWVCCSSAGQLLQLSLFSWPWQLYCKYCKHLLESRYAHCNTVWGFLNSIALVKLRDSMIALLDTHPIYNWLFVSTIKLTNSLKEDLFWCSHQNVSSR